MGPQLLAQVLRQMPLSADPDILIGLSNNDDAAVYRIADGTAVVLTVDLITPVVDDPYEFGRVAAANAISDVYAMGGLPLIGLNLVAFPSKTRPIEELQQILKGGSDQAAAAGMSVVGGHSIDDAEPKFGMVVMGTVHPDKLISNSAARPGDALVLTKPLGLGVINTAFKHAAAPPEAAAEALRVMTELNAAAAGVMRNFDVSACTDVTGFGLLGHLHEMVSASGVGAVVRSGEVPVIDGVEELIRMDYAPGGSYANMEYLANCGAVEWPDELPEEHRLILCDAQTSGGLLISVESHRADALKQALVEAGVSSAAIIGDIITDSKCRIAVAP